ncbi:MAG TPA: hypothetical protein DCQ34_09220 [Chitinophagaceae bacterium]|nr:hypothetical protein [Chitinophagaceae bacterium]
MASWISGLRPDYRIYHLWDFVLHQAIAPVLHQTISSIYAFFCLYIKLALISFQGQFICIIALRTGLQGKKSENYESFKNFRAFHSSDKDVNLPYAA